MLRRPSGTRTGCFIVIEGIDGTGKSTLARELHTRLSRAGLTCLLTAEPTPGPWGRALRESFSLPERLKPQEELELFLKDREEHVREVILPALAQGKVVVCDRYYFSTMAYQGARGLDVDDIRAANEGFAPQPDLVLLLELSPDAALKRIREGRGESPNNFEKREYLERVASLFAGLTDPFVTRLDASRPFNRVVEAAYEAALQRCKGQGA